MDNLRVGISWAGQTPLFKDLLNGYLEQAIVVFGINTDPIILGRDSAHTALNKALLSTFHPPPMSTSKSMVCIGYQRYMFLIGGVIILSISLQICCYADVLTPFSSFALASIMLTLSLFPMASGKIARILWIAPILHYPITTETNVNVYAIILHIDAIGPWLIQKLNADVSAHSRYAREINIGIKRHAGAGAISRYVQGINIGMKIHAGVSLHAFSRDVRQVITLINGHADASYG